MDELKKVDILFENLNIKCKYYKDDNVCKRIKNSLGETYCSCFGEIKNCEIESIQ